MSDDGLRESLTGSLYVAGWSAVRWMPERVAYAMFQRVADQTFAQGGAGVRRLQANLRRVVGPGLPADDLSRLTRAGLRSYLRYWCEVFRLPTWSAERVRERVEVRDVEILWDALDEGRGVVLALPHAANWDAAAAWVGGSGRVGDGAGPGGEHRAFVTVAERLKPESLYDRFVEYRESLGLEVLPLTGGGNVVGTLARRLRSGGLVCLPADRDITGSGVEVDFFGSPARMPGGPALLAMMAGSPLVAVDLWFDDDGRTIVQVHPPVEVSDADDRKQRIQETTQRVADLFAAGIAAHPEDWHMLQPLWVEDLDAAQVAREAAR